MFYFLSCNAIDCAFSCEPTPKPDNAKGLSNSPWRSPCPKLAIQVDLLQIDRPRGIDYVPRVYNYPWTWPITPRSIAHSSYTMPVQRPQENPCSLFVLICIFSIFNCY